MAWKGKGLGCLNLLGSHNGCNIITVPSSRQAPWLGVGRF